ncbi:MAG: ribosome biogenesis GTPase Der [Planctomycetota bacterium]
MELPKIAIVGRPNVGKSALFNVLAGRRIAIVDAHAGITRDRIAAEVRLGPRRTELIDTGGMGIEDSDDLTADVERQIETAMMEADILLFVLDVRDGILPLDKFVAERIRKLEKPVVLVANKADTAKNDSAAVEFEALGLGTPFVTSVTHRRGIDVLRERLVLELAAFPVEGEAAPSERPLKLVIVGKRNAGKSTLVNHLVGGERVIVSEVPGTTRDSVDVPVEVDGKRFVVIDTAGVRRRRSIKETVDFFSTARTRGSIRRSEVVIFLLDCTAPISSVDKKLGSYIVEENKPVVIGVNKFDLAGEVEPEKFRRYIDSQLRGLTFAPMVFISAKTGFNVAALLEVAEDLSRQARTRVTTGELNRVVREIYQRRKPRAHKGRLPKIYYATQTGVAPVTVVFFVSNPKSFGSNYVRYIENALRRAFPFEEVPIRVVFRESAAGERRAKARGK